MLAALESYLEHLRSMGAAAVVFVCRKTRLLGFLLQY
jgi:hypothetical protein